MRLRQARQALALELRRSLGPSPGNDRAFHVERLHLRSRDALLVVGRGDVSVALRLAPRDPRRPAPGDVPWSRWFLLLPADGRPVTTSAERALLEDVREQLRSGERRTLGGQLDMAFGDPPVLTVGVPGACEQSCVFCRDRRTPRWWRRTGPGRSARRDALAGARAALRAGLPHHRRVLFQGEDALAFPGLAELVSEADALGYEGIAVLTPGARLGEGALVERLVAAGLDILEVALYGATAEEHDADTRTPGSFDRLLAGLLRARRAGVHVIVHTALTRTTLPRLAAIAALSADRGFTFERAEAVAADRGQEERYCACAPTLGQIRGALGDALAALPRPFALVDVPDCALPAPVADVTVRRRPPADERWPSGHVGPCLACGRRTSCPGPSVAYVAAHGADDLSPFPES